MRFVSFLIFLALSGCGAAESVSVSMLSDEPIKFVSLETTIKFKDKVYSKGDSFEIKELSDGSSVVLLSNDIQTNIAAGGGMGAPVIAVPIPTRIINGIIVDSSLCSTDDYYQAVDDPVFGTIFDTSDKILTGGKPENIVWEPRTFCFAKQGN